MRMSQCLVLVNNLHVEIVAPLAFTSIVVENFVGNISKTQQNC